MHITKDIFNTIITSPKIQIKNIEHSQILQLKEKFPYCEIIHNLSLLKAHITNNINFPEALANCTIYSSNRINLFHLIHPKKHIIPEKKQNKKNTYLFEEWLNDNKTKFNNKSNDIIIEKSIAKSTEDNHFLTTETLAKIYVEQGHYERAIQAYEILCLKYPKKSGFFANQIKFIKSKIK